MTEKSTGINRVGQGFIRVEEAKGSIGRSRGGEHWVCIESYLASAAMAVVTAELLINIMQTCDDCMYSHMIRNDYCLSIMIIILILTEFLCQLR